MNVISISKNNDKRFNPNWFLKALGNGGLAVSFFMYLMFFIKHKTPIPIFSDVYSVLSRGTLQSWMTGAVLIIILYFSFRYFVEFIKQYRRYQVFAKTSAYQELLGTNDEISLMAIPLTMAMGVNVLFILGAVYIPNLWTYVEYLFPAAVAAFALIGAYALQIFIRYFKNTLTQGNFDFDKNNHLGQMIAPFAFIMVSVGIAASAAMSHTLATNIIAFAGSVFFFVLALFLVNLKLILGFKSILRQGVDEKVSPTLWILIPIVTLMGITLVRLISGVYHHFLDKNPNPVLLMAVLTTLISVQIIFGILGYAVMKHNRYFEKYIHGDAFHVGSFSLICPGVAFVVLGMFYIHYGFIKTGFVEQFSALHLLMVLPFTLVQVKTVLTLNKISRKSNLPQQNANALQNASL